MRDRIVAGLHASTLLAHPLGKQAMFQAAHDRPTELMGLIACKSDLHRAFWLYVHHPVLFEAATEIEYLDHHGQQAQQHDLGIKRAIQRDDASIAAFGEAIPKDFKGQIIWSEVDNRPFLRLAHGTLLGLMRRRGKAKGSEAVMALAKQMLAWCPMDNIGVRFLLGDIALLQGDHQAAMKEYLKGAPNSPAHWYQAALIAFREGDYVAACTYLRRGIAANPYIAEGLTGRTVLSEHLYWHASNVHGPEWAVDYLDSAACDWTPEEIDFVDWVFNASPVLKERAEMMALHEGMTYERDAEKRAPYAQRSLDFIDRITDTLSKKMVRRVKNRWGVEIWPWDRAGFQRPTNRSLQ
jgi:tetratricopeptide (TPR) repeat protein